MGKKNSMKTQYNFRVNDEITYKGDVRVIGDEIKSSVVSCIDAKKLAESMEMDLIEVNSKTTPPILKIGKYEKFIYEQKKKDKNKNHNTSQLKEVQLSVNIAKHDLDTKSNKAREFLSKGNKVKVILTMKGREMSRREENKRSLLEFIVSLEDVSSIENGIVDNGNKTFVILKKK